MPQEKIEIRSCILCMRASNEAGEK